MEIKTSNIMKILQCILGAFLIVSIAYFVIGELWAEKESYFKVGGSRSFNDGWEMVMSDGTKVPITVPGSCNVKSGDVLTIEKTIPQDMDGTWICIRSSQQDIKISVDGEVRENYSTKGTRKFGKNSVSVYIFAELFPEDAGKTLTMEIVSNSPYSGYVNDIYEGDREQIWTGFVRTYLPVTILALFMLLLSVMVVVYTIIVRCVYKNSMDISYLGVGLLVSSVWIIAESRLRQIFLPNSTIASDVGFFMVMLLPFPFMSYINQIQKRRYEKGFILIAICSVINFIISTLLQLSDVKDFSETMGASHIILVVLIVMIFGTVIADIKSGFIKEYKEVAFGLAGLMFAGLCEIYQVYDRAALYNGIALCLGLVFLFFMAVIKTGRDLLQLEKEKQIAVAASESKALFLANMSHEIRTPINTIVGMNEMIIRENHNNETREYAKNIESASKMLIGLIDDILDFSKLDAGKLEICENSYNVASMLNDVILGASVRLKGKEIDINLDIDEKLPSVLVGDEIRIKQIFNNLLSNAVKYTEQGSITISAKGITEKNKFQLMFSVTDTGVGIREEDMSTLFDSFQRMDLKRNKYIQGTGLGLNITKQLVDSMKGTIDVRSEYGSGSCFTVKIPQQVEDNTPMGDLMVAYANLVQQDEVKSERCFSSELSVLVVDDNEMNLMVMKALLGKTGLSIDYADSGSKCYDLCKTKKYDLIFMDHMMPEPDGVETLHMIRDDREGLNNDTNVIVLTANAIKGASEMYEKEGFTDYITKPVEYDMLDEMLSKYLSEEIKSQDKEITLNKEEGIKYCGGSEELYIEILETYVEKGKQYENEIDEYFKQKNWKEYARIAHTLKSTSLTIGASVFSEISKTHELAAKGEDVEFIKNSYDDFRKELKNILSIVEKEIKKA